jgi:hypothetical protein
MLIGAIATHLGDRFLGNIFKIFLENIFNFYFVELFC